jgi:tRNA threonylcarbamoyl adenosine modification protein YjeE
MIYKTSSEEETIKAAAAFAATLKPRDIILLNGDLGMGKSVFSRAVIRAITHNPDLDVPSPTFTLAQTYDTPMGDIWHFDLYRLKDPEELYEIGWEDALSSGIILVEWPERLDYLTPKKSITVTLAQGETPTSRVITVER